MMFIIVWAKVLLKRLKAKIKPLRKKTRTQLTTDLFLLLLQVKTALLNSNI